MDERAATSPHSPTWLDLYDYRERVSALYRERAAHLRHGDDPADVARHFRTGKDALFARHPQSALDEQRRRTFSGLSYFPYDPAFAVPAILTPIADDTDQTLEASGAHSMRFRLAGRMRFTLDQSEHELAVYWIDVYGGGLFLPFRDATSGQETYGGGRYLFDTVKGSDFLRLDAEGALEDVSSGMGYAGGRILLDFNYAYNPSCAYDARWVCPLAPSENRLPVAVRAGERSYHL